MDEHVPVLVEAALAALAPVAGGWYVDATFGRGGHTARLLQIVGREGHVLALDRDPQAIEAGRARFAGEMRLTLVQAPFAALGQVVREYAHGGAIRGVLFDLGVSSPQLDNAARGFSFAHDGPLDMRMDPSHGEPVAAWLARAPLDEVRSVIAELGEERFARRVAEAIGAARRETPISRTGQLATIVARAVRTREPGKHPATRTFQALRMFINDELGQLQRGLVAAHDLLGEGGRLVAISFHSLEDRAVKQFMRARASTDPMFAGMPVIPAAARPTMRLISKKQRADAQEVAANPRSRSAILRCAEKLPLLDAVPR